MTKTVQFLDANDVSTFIEIEIEKGTLSMSGKHDGSCGQCQDSIAPKPGAQAELIAIWNQYHLNDMKSGTPLQMKVSAGAKDYAESLVLLIQHNNAGEKMSENDAAIYREMWADFIALDIPMDSLDFLIKRQVRGMSDKEREEFFYFNIIARYGGNEFILFDKSKGETIKDRAEVWLFGKTLLFDNGYRYGSAWLKDKLPADIEERINKLCDQIIAEGGEEMADMYAAPADKLLAEWGITFKPAFLKHDTYFDDDKESRDIYKATFRRGKEQLNITFGQSLANHGVPPRAYDIMACLTKSDPGTFNEFCSAYGYDTDSRKAAKIYKAVVVEWDKVNSFFTDAELMELQEIN